MCIYVDHNSYQAVSYNLVSKRGNAAGLQNMVNACKAVGVGVIVDILWNHMAGAEGPDSGMAGTSFSRFSLLSQSLPSLITSSSAHYSYGDLYNEDDFHHCGLLATAPESPSLIASYDRRHAGERHQ